MATTQVEPLSTLEAADACCKPGTVDASCWLDQMGGDSLGAIQAAVGCSGADLVTVGRGSWVLNGTLHLNTSHQTASVFVFLHHSALRCVG